WLTVAVLVVGTSRTVCISFFLLHHVHDAWTIVLRGLEFTKVRFAPADFVANHLATYPFHIWRYGKDFKARNIRCFTMWIRIVKQKRYIFISMRSYHPLFTPKQKRLS